MFFKLLDAIDAIDLNLDRSNARIDYEGSDEDHESYPIDNEGSGQSKLPKINDCLVFEPKLNYYFTKLVLNMYYYL